MTYDLPGSFFVVVFFVFDDLYLSYLVVIGLVLC